MTTVIKTTRIVTNDNMDFIFILFENILCILFNNTKIIKPRITTIIPFLERVSKIP